MFLNISATLVMVRLHTENKIARFPGSVSKACVVGGDGG